MKPLKRREFLRVAGAGTAAAVAIAAAGPLAELIISPAGERRIRFQAVAGVPRPPLPAYASYVLKGEIDLHTRTGAVTKTIQAGAPGATSAIILPGVTRAIAVTAVRENHDGTIRVSGVIDGSAGLLPGEDPAVEFALDRGRGLAEASFFGSPIDMQLVEIAA